MLQKVLQLSYEGVCAVLDCIDSIDEVKELFVLFPAETQMLVALHMLPFFQYSQLLTLHFILLSMNVTS